MNYRIAPENFLNTFRYLALKYYEKDSYIRDIAVSARERKESYRDHEVVEADLERFENVTYLLQCFGVYECHERVIIDRTIFFNFFDKFQAGILLGSAAFWNDYYDAKASEMTNSLRAEPSSPNCSAPALASCIKLSVNHR